MSLVDSHVRRAASRAVRAYGTDCTLRKVAVGAYDPATDTVTNTPSDYPWRVRLDNYIDRELVSGAVRSGDRKATGAALDLSVAPDVDDQLVVGADVYDVVDVKVEMAKDLPALYILQVRR